MADDDPRPDPEWLLDVLKAIPSVVLLIDEDRTIRFINEPDEGYDEEEVIGAPAESFVEPDFREAFADLLDGVFETGRPERFEIPVTGGAGEREWYEGTLTPIFRGGGVTGVVVVTTNVTARHVAEERVRRLQHLVPVCSWCRRIRSDEGYWKELEAYIEDLDDRRVTHGICPECEREIADGDTENLA